MQFSKRAYQKTGGYGSRRRFLQNLPIRRFRKVMIKTSFQLFLLIKSDAISNIVIKFERVNRRYRALHCLAGLACLIFWFTHHGPRWPISDEKQRETPFFGRNWPPRPMMGDPKNQGCHLSNAPPNNADFLNIFLFFFLKKCDFSAFSRILSVSLKIRA